MTIGKATRRAAATVLIAALAVPVSGGFQTAEAGGRHYHRRHHVHHHHYRPYRHHRHRHHRGRLAAGVAIGLGSALLLHHLHRVHERRVVVRRPVYVERERVVVRREPVYVEREPVYVEREPVYVEREPVYVEREPAPEPAEFWYYCESERAYYPDVERCPEAWVPVPPRYR